ncbi:uncharacterized protein LOC142328157 [Lycorma delicatula]|uniref:uncharacterized protein LOC142328157 n=1 Tax=Lycorma delicatula TaxID=130591 RepID=UPI003F5114F6
MCLTAGNMFISSSNSNDKGKKMLSDLIDSTILGDDNQMSLYDDLKSFKEVVFQSDSEEDITDGKTLTSLVRESYLKHLRLVLKQNYQVWYENYINCNVSIEKEELKYLSDIDTEKCVKFLEQKALRSCMIASLYQKAMVHLISEVKLKTKETKLFDYLSRISELNIFTSDKCIQTDKVIIERCNVESQTIGSTNLINLNRNKKPFKTVSLLDLPLPDPKDVLQSLGSDFIEKNNPVNMKTNSLKSFNDNIHHSKETVAKVQPQPRKPFCKVLSNVSGHEQDFAPESKRRKINSVSSSVSNVNNCTSNNNNVFVNNKLKQKIDNYDLINMLTDDCSTNTTTTSTIITTTTSTITNTTINNNNINFNSYENNIDDSSDLFAPPNIATDCAFFENNINKSNNEVAQENFASLDDRIAEFGNLINEESNSSTSCAKTKQSGPSLPNSSIRGHRGSWFIEMTAYYCNFAKVFLSLNDNKKIKVKGRLNKFFGSDNNDDDETSVSDNIELTEGNLSICRKRTANMVVAELTPYFEAKKIPNRDLFKEFAKRVTNSILSRTYASDLRAVNRFITEYFAENDCIKSLDDIDF